MSESIGDAWFLDIVESTAIDFFSASALGLQDLIEIHVRRGQNVNATNEGGWTALMYACAFHKNNLVSYLLSMGAEITQIDNFGKTFLTVAAENQNFKALNSLNIWRFASTQEHTLQYWNDLNVVKRIINLQEYKYGFTPIMFSASQGDIDMVKALLRLGADTTVKDARGRTAAELAILNGHKTTYWVLKFSRNFTIRDVLIEINLEKYTNLFTNIRTDELLSLEDRDLKELGMKLLGPRKKLKLTIDNLNQIKKYVMNVTE